MIESKKLFIKEFIKKPREIGSIIPSSRHLAKQMSNVVKTLPRVDLLQIGAGTGIITQFLPKENLTVIEINESLATQLSNKFSEIKIINDCGVKFLTQKNSEFGCIITIPLINNPIAPNLLKTLQSLHRKKILKWCVIFSYGITSPLKKVGFEFSEKSNIIWKNLPPARVWTYY